MQARGKMQHDEDYEQKCKKRCKKDYCRKRVKKHGTCKRNGKRFCLKTCCDAVGPN